MTSPITNNKIREVIGSFEPETPRSKKLQEYWKQPRAKDFPHRNELRIYFQHQKPWTKESEKALERLILGYCKLSCFVKSRSVAKTPLMKDIVTYVRIIIPY